MLLIATFAVLAMVLAGVGIYGVFTYWVSLHRKEMAIRLALGSSRRDLLRLPVSQAMRLIFAGGVIGIAGAWFLESPAGQHSRRRQGARPRFALARLGG